MKDWICPDCFARRLNPDNPATTIEELMDQIVWKRRRLGSKKHNIYGGWLPEEYRIALRLEESLGFGTSNDFKTLTAAQCGERETGATVKNGSKLSHSETLP